MRWQDETPIHELVAEGARIDGAYLTIARVGEDRKEAQIGSRPVGTVTSAREWIDHSAVGAVADGGEARLRVRLWRADRSPIRGVTSRVWADDGGHAAGPRGIGAGYIIDLEHAEEPTPGVALAPPQDPPSTTSLVTHRARPVTTRTAKSTHPPSRFQGRPVPASVPLHAATCPTCVAATTTTALLQSRIAELSAMLGTSSTTVRDARRETAEAEKLAKARGHRAKDAETEAARLRTETAELVAANRALRREVKDLNAGAAKLLAVINTFDG